jgi:hypothetical protein
MHYEVQPNGENVYVSQFFQRRFINWQDAYKL